MSKEFNIVGMNYEMVDETSNAVIGKFTDFNIVKSLLGVNTGVFCEYPKGMLVIDIDDEITSAIAIEIIKTFSLKCYILKTTRGIHIYFKKPKDAKNLKKVGMLLATGLKCDFLGSNNLRERVVKGGVVREWYDEKFAPLTPKINLNELDELPPYFKLTTIKELTPFLEVEASGREVGLYNIKNSLLNSGTKPEDIVTIIKLLNQKLSVPLDNKEIENTVLKQLDATANTNEQIRALEMANKSKVVKAHLNSFVPDDFIKNTLLSRLHVYKEKDVMFYWLKDHWTNKDNWLESLLIDVDPWLLSKNRCEIITRIKCLSPESYYRVETNNNTLNLENGTLILKESGENMFFPNVWNPKFFNKYKLDVTYDPKIAPSQPVDLFLDSVLGAGAGADKEQVEAFWKYLGYTLFDKSNSFKTMAQFIDFDASANNGKTTLKNMVANFLSSRSTNLYSNVHLNTIDSTKNKFDMGQMYNKLANFDDEGTKGKLNQHTTEDIKRLLSPNAEVDFEFKHQNSQTGTFYTKFWVFANSIVGSVVKTPDWVSKQLVFVMKNHFTMEAGNIDRDMINKISTPEAKSYILNKAIEGYQNLLRDKGWGNSNTMLEGKAKYKELNDNTIQWLAEVGYTPSDLIDTNVVNLYKDYAEWTALNSVHPYPLNAFKESICATLKLKVVTVKGGSKWATI